jgi:monomeric isocitrate dehydrogenase
VNRGSRMRQAARTEVHGAAEGQSRSNRISALAAQDDDPELAARFAPIADQDHPNDIGGYSMPNMAEAQAAMHPSQTFDDIITRF